MANIFHSVPEVECRMCKGEYRKEKIFQLHVCVDSSTCFNCLANWRLNDTTTLAYATNFEDWWKENELKCPICKTVLKHLKDINADKWKAFVLWMNYKSKGMECTNEEEIRRTFTAEKVAEVAKLKGEMETLRYKIDDDKEQLARAQNEIYTLKENRKVDQFEFMELKRKFKETKKELERVSKDWCNVMREKDDILVEERKFKRKLFRALAGEFDDVAKRSKKQKKEQEESSLGDFHFMFPIAGISEIYSDEETQPLR